MLVGVLVCLVFLLTTVCLTLDRCEQTGICEVVCSGDEIFSRGGGHSGRNMDRLVRLSKVSSRGQGRKKLNSHSVDILIDKLI